MFQLMATLLGRFGGCQGALAGSARGAGRVSPHTQELWLLSGRRGLRLHLQAVDVSDGDDGGGHIPRQAHEGADHHEHGHPEQVQVVACPFLDNRQTQTQRL